MCSNSKKWNVHFVKQNTINLGYSTLAIGGNDVNMIKEASIGLFGKEGYQASFNSDYAISKFKYLSRLLLYYGRFSLMRNSYFIFYFFYKSTFGFYFIMVILVQLYMMILSF